MGDSNNTFNFVAPLAGVVLNNRVSQDVDMVTLRFNYRFGGYGVGGYGSPGVGKY